MWDPKSETTTCNRQSAFKQRPTSVYHPTSSAPNHSFIHHRYVHPSQVQPIQSSIATTHAYIPPQYNNSKPKSWDNLGNKSGVGGGNYASGINNNAYMNYQVPTNKGQQQQSQQIPQGHVIISRKSNQAPYGRYSAYTEVENYVPAPQAFLQEETITKTTIITTKSTENLIKNAQYDGSCECLAPHTTASTQRSPKPTVISNCAVCNNAANFNANHQPSYQGYYSNLTRNNPTRYIPTKTEITRL